MARAPAALGPRGLVLLVIATLFSLAVGGSCDSGRRRLREESRAFDTEGGGYDGGAGAMVGGLVPPAFGADNSTTPPDDDRTLLVPPSYPEVTAILTAQCDQCSVPRAYDCVGDIKADCDAKANFDCPSCGLWRKVKECLESVTKRDCLVPPVYYSPSNAIAAGAVTWLVQPLSPLIGVENFMRGNAGPDATACWTYGWDDAIAGTTERPQIAAGDLTIVINAISYRSMHSMHFHVGRKSAAWASCVNSLPLPPQGVWWRASCKGLAPKDASIATELKYVWPVGGRANANWAAQEGLKQAGNSVTAGVAMVAYPHTTSDDNLVIVFDGPGVFDGTLVRQT